jgi:hypothetical protein
MLSMRVTSLLPTSGALPSSPGANLFAIPSIASSLWTRPNGIQDTLIGTVLLFPLSTGRHAGFSTLDTIYIQSTFLMVLGFNWNAKRVTSSPHLMFVEITCNFLDRRILVILAACPASITPRLNLNSLNFIYDDISSWPRACDLVLTCFR